MDGADLFNACLAQATLVIKQIRPEQMANATPDSEWSVRDLVTHMLYELSWVPDLIAGATIEEVGTKYDGDLVGEDDIDLSIRWQMAADKAEMAVNEADLDEVAHVSYGNVTIDEYLTQAAGDQLIHAWDVGRAIGVPISFNPMIAQEIYDLTLPQRDKLQASGLFAAAIDVPKDSSIQVKLLGLFGRAADWRRPAEAA